MITKCGFVCLSETLLHSTDKNWKDLFMPKTNPISEIGYYPPKSCTRSCSHLNFFSLLFCRQKYLEPQSLYSFCNEIWATYKRGPILRKRPIKGICWYGMYWLKISLKGKPCRQRGVIWSMAKFMDFIRRKQVP